MAGSFEREVRMFKVRDKESENVYTVYSVRTDLDGNIQFLIYNKNWDTWSYVDAIYYKPYEEDG